MNKRTLVGFGLVTACLAISPASAGDIGTTAAEVNKNLSVAIKWINGDLDSYGSAKVTYTGKPITFKTSHHLPKVSGLAKIQIKGFKILEKMSGGKIKVNDTWSKTVHGVKDGRKAVRTGLSDHAPCFSLYMSKDYNMVHGLGLPFMFRNAHEAVATGEMLYPKYLKKEHERFKGVKIARVANTSTYHLFTNKPVRSLADIKGMKIRAGGGNHSKIIGALGATQVSMPLASAYTAMQRGTLDAIHSSDAIAPIFKVHEVTKFRTTNGFNVLTIEYCTSGKFLDRLPADLKQVYNNWARQYAQIEAQYFYDRLDSNHLAMMMNKHGIKKIDLAPAELERWKKTLEPITQNWIAMNEKKGLPARQFIADVRAASKKFAGMSANDIMLAAINSPVKGMYDF
ncbi:MAG: TRAP transporter substrate-binding protein DctP [Pseudomonadota bacterium]|nr:TRAP transporter substrate-binding protein DctP [Pseudomonadota bacterium]